MTARVTKAELKAQDRQYAINTLKDHIELGHTGTPRLYTVLRHVSRSGMQRRISVLAWDQSGIYVVDHLVGQVLGWRVHPEGGVVVNGAGMDMGFELVYVLSRAIYGDGYKIDQRWL